MYRLLSVALLLCSVAFANEGSFEPFTGKVLGTKVRMRTGPSLDDHVVREVNFGELFAVTEEREGFYAVTPPPSTKGYVFRTFVLDNVVEGSHVNVRLYPDMEAPIVGQLNTGDTIDAKVSDVNNKWLVIDLPETSRFFIAEEYFEKVGPLEMLAQVRERHNSATQDLESACFYAQSQIGRPLPQVDLDGIRNRFAKVIETYHDLPEIVESAEETSHLIGEVYLQKKIAFLENKAGESVTSLELNPAHIERLEQLGVALRSSNAIIADAASETLGLAPTLAAVSDVTDKMLVWEPIERSLHHLWAATHQGSIEDFYSQQQESAVALTGMVESYNRPVKNLPGDYLLRVDNHPVAFLYSTKVNLDKLVGRQVTIMGSPRSNNHFAFPAYFVLSID